MDADNNQRYKLYGSFLHHVPRSLHNLCLCWLDPSFFKNTGSWVMRHEIEGVRKEKERLTAVSLFLSFGQAVNRLSLKEKDRKRLTGHSFTFTWQPPCGCWWRRQRDVFKVGKLLSVRQFISFFLSFIIYDWRSDNGLYFVILMIDRQSSLLKEQFLKEQDSAPKIYK